MSYVTLEVSKIRYTKQYVSSSSSHSSSHVRFLKNICVLRHYKIIITVLGCGQSATLPCAHFVYSRHGAVPVFADVASSNVNDDTNK
jgi:hypothetical protein